MFNVSHKDENNFVNFSIKHYNIIPQLLNNNNNIYGKLFTTIKSIFK